MAHSFVNADGHRWHQHVLRPLPHSRDHDRDVFFRKWVTGTYVGENVAFSRRFLLDGRQTVNPTVSQTQERDVLYPPSRHRERGGLMNSANMPPHVEVSFRKGVCVHGCVKKLYILTHVSWCPMEWRDTPQFMPNVTSFMGQEQVSGWSGNGPDVLGLNCLLVQIPFLIIHLESCELDSFLLSFEPTTGYEQRPNVVVTQPKQAFQNNITYNIT